MYWFTEYYAFTFLITFMITFGAYSITASALMEVAIDRGHSAIRKSEDFLEPQDLLEPQILILPFMLSLPTKRYIIEHFMECYRMKRAIKQNVSPGAASSQVILPACTQACGMTVGSCVVPSQSQTHQCIGLIIHKHKVLHALLSS